MATERPMDTVLKTMLINNAPFVYAHLIKFERPARVEANGKPSTSKERYTYLTDASRDVNFDDGSKNLLGVPNGSQVYLANKVLKVGNITEQTQATPSNYSLVLDGNGIGATATANAIVTSVNSTTWDIAWPANIDLVSAGFREGDKITLTGFRTGSFNIEAFRVNNVLRIKKIDDTLTAGSGSLTISLSSEEIKSILLDKTLPEYASFVNREVFIYRGYFQDGEVIGSPILIFKGIVSTVGFEEDDSGIKVSWGLTSHWGDFAQVKGRITSDDFHRALDQSGIPQPQSAIKTAYAYDKGFSHAETSLNVLATYTVQVEKQDVKAKNGFLGLGIGAKVKVTKTLVNEDRNTKLNLQLQAKSIPVVYGVRTVNGIPIFADTLNNNSSTLYVAYALSEGEIGGLYDVYVNGNSLICNDKADFDARSTQTTDNTVELVCRGRADRGDVLGGTTSINPNVTTDFYINDEYLISDFSYNYVTSRRYTAYIPPVSATANTIGRGVVDGESLSLTSPQKINIDFFSGRPGQKAASSLVEIAAAKNFKIQNSYWNGTDTAEYWGPNHRLLDTAYVVTKVIIEEGETTNPDLEFVIKGKNIECYNYDYSYSHYTKATGELETNFSLGDFVTLFDTSNNSLGTVQIIDKWTFRNSDGSANVRFRFSSIPPLGYLNGVPTVTKFYMKNASNQSWTMVTYNYEEFRGTIASTVESPITGVSSSGGNVAFSYTSNPNFGVTGTGTYIDNYYPYVSLIAKANPRSLFLNNDLYNTNRILTGKSWTSNQYVTTMPDSTLAAAQSAVQTNLTIVSRNTAVLSSSANSTDNYYNGYYITLYKYNASTDKQYEQTRLITGYKGSSRTITVEDMWDADMYPEAGDTVVIYPPYRDKRSSINPAIQTLDYISSPTYGKNLNVSTDIDLESWLATARVCDTQSSVTVNHTNTVFPTPGKIYKWPATGTILWQGRVAGSDGNYTEFEDVIGKLSSAWNNWRSFAAYELVYADNRLYMVTSPGTKLTKPTHTLGTVNGLEYVGPGVQLTSTNGGPALTMFVAGNPVRALKNGTVISGYSLYDCDEVNYWRYLGWDEFNQRYVTQHQTNLTIDTSLPLFDNINSLLEHFGGILRYSAGKYYLDIETLEPTISTLDTEPRNITSDHIIGKIRLSDDGTKTAYNSLTAAFADPANKFESRNVSFFNSEYLKIDRNVQKKGNLSIPGITNYYNTRLLADKFLNKSRFGLSIAFNMAPRGILLLSGTVIQVQYPRFNWVNKKFRISNITLQEDCTVDVVAEEYDDSFYNLSKLSKQAGSGAVGQTTVTSISSPTNLATTNIASGDELPNGVRITWTNSPDANTKNVYTELYSSFSPNLFITVNTISGNVLTSVTSHGLVVGEMITSYTTLNGLESGKSYFIKSIPSPTTFTLSATKGGNTLGLSNGNTLGISLMTASLIETVPTPNNSAVDPVGGKDGRVNKYYWVRHKVIKE